LGVLLKSLTPSRAIIILLYFLITFGANANEEKNQISIKSWKIAGEHVLFVQFKKKPLLISKGCESESNNCLASKAIREVRFDNLKSGDLIGGKNPGSVLCHKIDKAKIIFGVDTKNRMNSFCQFDDGSLVSSDSLLSYSKLNMVKK